MTIATPQSPYGAPEGDPGEAAAGARAPSSASTTALRAAEQGAVLETRLVDTAAQTHADRDDFDGRFWRHFPTKSNDFALVVLKGHLLLEESTNRLLAALLRKPEAIDGANFRFHQKLCLIRALLPVLDPREVDTAEKLNRDVDAAEKLNRDVDAAEKLNTLRNRLAHHLEHPPIEALVREFVSLCEEHPETKSKPLIYRLKRAIAFVWSGFEGMSNGLEAVRAAKPEPV